MAKLARSTDFVNALPAEERSITNGACESLNGSTAVGRLVRKGTDKYECAFMPARQFDTYSC